MVVYWDNHALSLGKDARVTLNVFNQDGLQALPRLIMLLLTHEFEYLIDRLESMQFVI